MRGAVCQVCSSFQLPLESMSALFDFSSLLVVILLFICATTFTRALYPTIFNSPPDAHGKVGHTGLIGLCWKASRIGERISPYVAGACVLMAFHVLFLK
jgi:hypothetical protein